MTRKFSGLLPALVLLALPVYGQSMNTMRLSDDTAEFGGTAELTLSLSTTDQVQGFVAVFDWDDSALTGVDLTTLPALAEADTVITRVESSFMILGVVMDSDPNDPGSPEVIGPGDVDLARVQLDCGADPNPDPGDETNTPVVFRDGMYATVDGGPALDNIVVVGGFSIGELEGLNLDGGSVRCIETPDKLVIEDGTNGDQTCGDVRILMSNNNEVEGFVLAICHNDPQLRLDSIVLGSAASAADFKEDEIDPLVGGTFGVIMDLTDPMAMPPNILPGVNQHIATFRYCCSPLPPPGQERVTILEFCDNAIGSPLKENLIVVGGRSITEAEGLLLEDGRFVCRGGVRREDICDDLIDNDEDGFIDCEDTDCRFDPACVEQSFLCGARDLVMDPDSGFNVVDPQVKGNRGSEVEVCFFILNPEDNMPGEQQLDHIQGFSMAVEFCADLSCTDSNPVFDITGTILEALGAEFVTAQCRDTLNERGKKELIVGVLIDALPPFTGDTIPPLPEAQRMGCVLFTVNPNANCDEKCRLEFVDGLKGNGRVPIKNLISVENMSFSPATVPCEVCVLGAEEFHRGDCNFSQMGSMSVDIADAAAVVSHLFLPGTWKFPVPCEDACDCNDDGRLDLADSLCILQFLFRMGDFPPNPGPGFDENGNDRPAGPDPTPDKLDCEMGAACN